MASDLRRIRRCLQDSTEFRVERRWNGTLCERRGPAPGPVVRVDGGRELIRAWIGERVLEVLDGRPPRLRALFRKSWWFPGQDCVYICAPTRDELSSSHRKSLLEGYERLQAMTTGRVSAPRRGPDPA